MKWVRVFAAPHLHMAQLVLHQLEAAGIPARVFGDRAGLGGLIPMQDALAEVRVPEPHLAAAREALGLDTTGDLSLAAPDGALSWPGGTAPQADGPTEQPPCAQCGAEWEPGFGECWNCQQPR